MAGEAAQTGLVQDVDALIDLALDYNLPPDSYFSRWTEIADWLRAVVDHFGGARDKTILDVGCGAARLGAAILPEIGEGLYVGVDPIEEYVRLGQHIAEQLGAGRRTRLAVSSSFEFPVENVDLAIAQSVFTHLTPEDCLACLESLRGVMKPGAPFVFTHLSDPKERSRGSLYLRRYPFVHKRSADTMPFRDFAARHGLRFEDFDAIEHPTGQRTAVITF